MSASAANGDGPDGLSRWVAQCRAARRLAATLAAGPGPSAASRGAESGGWAGVGAVALRRGGGAGGRVCPWAGPGALEAALARVEPDTGPAGPAAACPASGLRAALLLHRSHARGEGAAGVPMRLVLFLASAPWLADPAAEAEVSCSRRAGGSGRVLTRPTARLLRPRPRSC